MAIDKLNIQSKIDSATKLKLIASGDISASETILSTEINAVVNKVNEVVDAYNFGAPITAFNSKGNVPTYADLATVENPQLNDGYGVIADGLIYVFNGTSFPPDGDGMDLRLKPDENSKVEDGNPLAVSGGEVFLGIKKTMQPNELPTLVKYLYTEPTRTTDSGLQQYPNSMSSGVIEVKEGDILDCKNGYTNQWSLWDEGFTSRIVLNSPARVPSGRKYAAVMYSYGNVGGGENAVVSVVRNKIPENALPFKASIYGKRIVSNQLFNKSNYRNNTRFTNNGVLATFEGGKTTQDIPIPEGVMNVTISGLVGGYNKFIRFLDSNMTIISSGSFNPNPHTRAIPVGSKYFTVYFDRGTDGPDIVDSFMMNWGQSILEKDNYKEAIVEIDGEPIYSPNNESVNVDYIDERFNNQNENRKLARKVEAYEKTLSSLRKIKTTTAGEVDFFVKNSTGADITDVNLIINLHHGTQSYENNGNDVYLNGLSNTDFSDIRFLDSDGGLLNFVKESSGNYELCPDSRIKMYMCEHDGVLFGTDAAGVHISYDNLASWTLLKAGATEALGFNQLGDLFYSKGNDLFKATKSSNYVNDYLVLSSATTVYWRDQNFDMDDLGYLYIGRYQDPFDARIYKSIDNGNTWAECFYDSTQQHIHTITIDRTVIPNTIYAACDGSTVGVNRLSTFKSIDRGVTWTKLPIQFFSDYGVFYAGEGFRLGGGEAAIKNTPSVFRTEDDSVYYPVVDTMLQTLRAQGIENTIYIAGCSRSLNKYSKILRSTDKGKSFHVVLDQQYHNSEANSNGYRYGGRKVITPQGGDPQLMMVYGQNASASFKGLRIFEGGNHYQGLFYVHLPFLPAAGKTIKVGYGYLVEDVQEDVFFKPKFSNHVINLPLNELGSVINDNLGNNYKLDKFNWRHSGKRIAYIDQDLNEDNAAVTITSKVEIINPYPVKKGFTINWWMDLASITATIRPIIRVNNYLIYLRSVYIGIRTETGAVYEQFIYTSIMYNKMLMLSVVFDENNFRIIINGGAFKTPDIHFVANEVLSNKIVLGEKAEDVLSTAYITDIDVYNKVLTDDEMLRIFECGKIYRPLL